MPCVLQRILLSVCGRELQPAQTVTEQRERFKRNMLTWDKFRRHSPTTPHRDVRAECCAGCACGKTCTLTHDVIHTSIQVYHTLSVCMLMRTGITRTGQCCLPAQVGTASNRALHVIGFVSKQIEASVETQERGQWSGWLWSVLLCVHIYYCV
jgi:hypothetical protein